MPVVRTVKKVVILGGGIGGRTVLENLYKYAQKEKGLLIEALLIDRKEYGETTPFAVRAWVVPAMAEAFGGKLQDVYQDYTSPFLSVRFVVGEVRRVSAHSVHLCRPSDGRYEDNAELEEIPFDALLVATGTNYPIFKGSAVHIEERKEELRQWAERISNANRVLIVGGGVVGVEIVGEMLAINPQKHITLVHSEPLLVPSNPRRVGDQVLKKLSGFPNVKILLGQKVDLEQVRTLGLAGTHEYTTTKGETITADIAILTVGNQRPNTTMFEQALGDTLTPTGFIKVHPTLQVEGHENMFVIGDALNLQVAKLASNCRWQADIVAKNVLAYLKSAKKLPAQFNGKLTPTNKAPGMVTLGPMFGILALVNMFGRSPSGAWASKMKTDLLMKSNPSAPVTWKR